MLKLILKNVLIIAISVPFFYYVAKVGLLASIITPGILVLISTIVDIKHRISSKKENADK